MLVKADFAQVGLSAAHKKIVQFRLGMKLVPCTSGFMLGFASRTKT